MNFIELRTEIFILYLKRLWSVFEQYTSDQSNDIHEASCRWLGYIGMERGGSFRTTQGFGRSRNWTSFSILGLLIKNVCWIPSVVKDFFKWFPKDRITEGYCGIRLIYYWVVASERELSIWVLSRCVFMPTFFIEIDIQIYKLAPS